MTRRAFLYSVEHVSSFLPRWLPASPAFPGTPLASVRRFASFNAVVLARGFVDRSASFTVVAWR